ncbi:MAG: hypothetical protein HY922_11155 [Elusimicrobia bacterium]|nr:hypothetical protein [Elusimicrobiota bacterium]
MTKGLKKATLLQLTFMIYGAALVTLIVMPFIFSVPVAYWAVAQAKWAGRKGP